MTSIYKYLTSLIKNQLCHIPFLLVNIIYMIRPSKTFPCLALNLNTLVDYHLHHYVKTSGSKHMHV